MAPTPVESPGLEAASRQGRRPGRPTALRDAGPHIAFVVILLGVVGLVDGNGGPSLLWPALFAVGGIAVLWRQADQAQRERWLDTTTRLDVRRLVVGSGGWAAYARLAAGLGLLVTALLLFAVQTGQLQVAQDIVVAATLGVAGLAVILGPWLVRLVSDLGRGARGAGAHAGAGRRRRPPARLGAPDPGPDPEERRRPRPGGDPGPGAGARPPVVDVRRHARRRRDRHRRPAGGRRRGRGRPRGAGRGRRGGRPAGSGRRHRARPRRPPGRPRGDGQRRAALRRPRRSTSTPRSCPPASGPAPSTSSSATAVAASTPTPCRPTGSGCGTASWTG